MEFAPLFSEPFLHGVGVVGRVGGGGAGLLPFDACRLFLRRATSAIVKNAYCDAPNSIRKRVTRKATILAFPDIRISRRMDLR